MEILDNLVYNALKFTPAKGSIRLSGKKEKGGVEITVSDSGQGIPEEKLRNLFNQEKWSQPRCSCKARPWHDDMQKVGGSSGWEIDSE
jgi:K+-sensing histidine kinase KdpD